MAIADQISRPLEVPFKDFQAGKVIRSQEINDDMKSVEDKVNEIITKHNATVKSKDEHVESVSNPHGVTAHQVDAYTKREVDILIANVMDRIDQLHK